MDSVYAPRRCSIFLPQGKGESYTPQVWSDILAVFQRIYTDANLYDPEEFLIISESANQILGDLEIKAQDDNVELPSDIELVLEIVPAEEGPICGYYFINHKSRCLFWLEKFDAEIICAGIYVVVSSSHLRKFGLCSEPDLVRLADTCW
jgi:hypothetical protein